MMIFLAIALIVFGAIQIWIAKKRREKAYRYFIAESAPDKKDSEIAFFWNRVKVARTRAQKQAVRETQHLYVHHFRWNQASLVMATISFLLAIILLAKSGVFATIIC